MPISTLSVRNEASVSFGTNFPRIRLELAVRNQQLELIKNVRLNGNEKNYILSVLKCKFGKHQQCFFLKYFWNKSIKTFTDTDARQYV